MPIFTLAVCCVRAGHTFIATGSVYATSKGHAEAMGLRMAFREYPIADGYIRHKVVADPFRPVVEITHLEAA